MSTGKVPAESVLKEWYHRLLKLGSALSIARMALRVGSQVKSIKFLSEQVKKYVAGESTTKKKEWALNSLELIGGTFDNWYFFCSVSKLAYILPQLLFFRSNVLIYFMCKSFKTSSY